MKESKNLLKQFLRNYYCDIKVGSLKEIDYQNVAAQFGESEKFMSPIEEREICENLKKEIENNNGIVSFLDNKELEKLISKIPDILFSENFKWEGKIFYKSYLFDHFLIFLKKEKKFTLLKKVFNQIIFHKNEIDNYDTSQIQRVYSFLQVGQLRSSKKIVESNKMYPFLTDNDLKELSKVFLREKTLSFTNHRYWPIRKRHLSGGLGRRFLKCLLEALDSKSEADVRFFLNYITFLKDSGLEIEVKIIGNLCVFVDKLSKVPRDNSKDLRLSVEKISDDDLGDPRWNPSGWQSIPEAKKIIIQWKKEKSIKNFFSLLDYISKSKINESVGRMWPHRKNFIEAYYEEGHIHGAWFILGKAAHSDKEKFLEKGSEGSFGILNGGLRDHCVLLIEIGSLVLSEWSHTGKVRIWKSNFPNAPKLYQKEYSREDLIFQKNKDGEIAEIVHRPPPEQWQKRLADIIYRHTNIDLRKRF